MCERGPEKDLFFKLPGMRETGPADLFERAKLSGGHHLYREIVHGSENGERIAGAAV